MNNYEDIINLKRPKSKRSKMSLCERASIFAPFSALTGYEEELIEIARMTESKKILEEDKNKELNNYFDYLKEHKEVLIKITYFEKDIKKEGGKYQTIISKLKKIDEIKKEVVLENREKIKVENICNIELIT